MVHPTAAGTGQRPAPPADIASRSPRANPDAVSESLVAAPGASSGASLGATEELARAVLASHPAHIAVVNRDGVIVMVNDAWVQFAHENGAQTSREVGLGANYLNVCGAVHGERGEEGPAAAEGIRAVLEGRR